MNFEDDRNDLHSTNKKYLFEGLSMFINRQNSKVIKILTINYFFSLDFINHKVTSTASSHYPLKICNFELNSSITNFEATIET